MKTKVRPFGDFVLCLFGPIVWAMHFFTMYGAEALACTRSPDQGLRLPAALATAAALASLTAFLIWQIRRRPHRVAADSVRFLSEVGIALAAMSMLAVFAVAWPVLHLPICASPFG